MSEVLPKGWAKSCLAEVCTKPQYGWTTSAISTGNIKLLRTTDISNGKIDWEKVPYCQKEPDDLEKFLINENDILVSRAGSVGISYRITKRELLHKAVFASYLIRFCPLVQPSFIGYYLRSHQYWSYISDSSLGIAVPNVNASKLSELPVPLPPFNEQKRIVTKLDSIMPRIEAVKKRLDKVPGILKRFRQSVLTAAVTGKLTEKWREEHTEIEKVKTSLSIFSDKNFDNYLNIYWETQDYTLPETWIYAPLCNLGTITGGGTPSKSKPLYWVGNIPWISPKDMKLDRITAGKDFITEKAVNESSVKIIPKGSVIFVVRGMILAHTFPVALTMNEVTINQDMKGIAPIEDIDNEFFFLILKSIQRKVLGYIKEATHGTLRLEMPLIKTFACPVPPLEEQKEIVQQVDNLFALADKVEDHYKKAKSKIDNLSQSVLAKAFRGELVPHDPNDEPAEKLLGRIMEEKMKMESALKAVKKRIPQRKKAIKQGKSL